MGGGAQLAHRATGGRDGHGHPVRPASAGGNLLARPAHSGSSIAADLLLLMFAFRCSDGCSAPCCSAAASRRSGPSISERCRSAACSWRGACSALCSSASLPVRAAAICGAPAIRRAQRHGSAAGRHSGNRAAHCPRGSAVTRCSGCMGRTRQVARGDRSRLAGDRYDRGGAGAAVGAGPGSDNRR